MSLLQPNPISISPARTAPLAPAPGPTARRAQQLRALVLKECRDAGRDRRGVGAALVYCVVGPLLVAFTAQALIRQETDPRPLHVALEGAEAAPHLRAHLLAQDVTLVPLPAEQPSDDPRRAALATGEVDAVVRVGERARETWANGDALELTLFVDGHAGASQRRLDRLVRSLEEWSRRATEARLVARGVAPQVARPVRIEIADYARSTPRGDALSTMLLVYLMLAPFFASTAVAADLVAGERERATLEQLLVQPAPPLLLVIAKWVPAAMLGVAGTAGAVALGAGILARLPLHELGVRLDLGASVQLRMILLLIPLALAAAAVQVLVAAAASSYKEAQTYLTLLAFFPAAVAMAAAFDPALAAGAARALPLLGQLAALRALLEGAPGGASSLFAAASCLALAVVCLPIGSHLLARERGLAGG